MTDYDPPTTFRFTLKMDGEDAPQGGFSDVSGLTSQVTVAELHEGGENRFAHKLPGQQKYDNLVLKRGLLPASGPLAKWLEGTLAGDLTQAIQPKTLTLSLLNEVGEAVIAWTISGAWPVKWSMSPLHAAQDQIAIETLELAVGAARRVDPAPGPG